MLTPFVYIINLKVLQTLTNIGWWIFLLPIFRLININSIFIKLLIFDLSFRKWCYLIHTLAFNTCSNSTNRSIINPLHIHINLLKHLIRTSIRINAICKPWAILKIFILRGLWGGSTQILWKRLLLKLLRIPGWTDAWLICYQSWLLIYSWICIYNC